MLNLSSSLICDVLDSMGVRESFCGPLLKELWQGARISGEVITLRCVPTDKIVENPYSGLIKLFKIIKPGEVIVIESGDQASGVWGELLSVAAMSRGAIGVITDGLVRDKKEITELRFPVFCSGNSPLDSSGRQIAIEMQTEIRCGQVRVSPKDWIIADDLGVVVVPQSLVSQVFKLALEKQIRESFVRSELTAGQDLGEVFARHGIL